MGAVYPNIPHSVSLCIDYLMVSGLYACCNVLV